MRCILPRLSFAARTMSAAAAGGGGGSTLRQPQHISTGGAVPPQASSARLHPVAPVSQIAQGISGFGTSLVVVKRGEALAVLAGACPHKQGELVLGDVADIEELSIICPRHRKKFPGGLHISCSTGATSCPNGQPSEEVQEDWRVPVYKTSVESGWLFYEEKDS
jgi:nitrite reductase/ring-hydroxylating ferredoxin subunit